MTIQENFCAGCRHWQVDPPPGWKNEYDFMVVVPDLYDWADHGRKKVRDGEWEEGSYPNWRSLKGRCLLYPIPVPAAAIHQCGQFSWVSRVNVQNEIREILGGSGEPDKLHFAEVKVKRLTLQRDHARRLAKSRWERLQKEGG